VKIFSSMEEATKHNSVAWAVIEILPDANDPTACPVLSQHTHKFAKFERKQLDSVSAPLVTLRFHPASIPDTRNLM
jgi:hypothetical protein